MKNVNDDFKKFFPVVFAFVISIVCAHVYNGIFYVNMLIIFNGNTDL